MCGMLCCVRYCLVLCCAALHCAVLLDVQGCMYAYFCLFTCLTQGWSMKYMRTCVHACKRACMCVWGQFVYIITVRLWHKICGRVNRCTWWRAWMHVCVLCVYVWEACVRAVCVCVRGQSFSSVVDKSVWMCKAVSAFAMENSAMQNVSIIIIVSLWIKTLKSFKMNAFNID